MHHTLLSLAVISLPLQVFAADLHRPLDGWKPSPTEWTGAEVKDAHATLASDKWAYLIAPDAAADVEVAATIKLRSLGKLDRYFGKSWSVWPDKTYGDQGWDAGLILRAGESSGYRVQASWTLGEVALVKFPAGGYVRSVPFKLAKETPLALSARIQGNRITVSADGKELFRYVDSEPLSAGKLGVGVNSGSKVEFTHVRVTPLPSTAAESIPAHVPNFTSRKWLGGRQWVFDGTEPIMLLPALASSYINNIKLRPGMRPLLSFNSHWDVQNQGAYAEAKNDTVDVTTSGGGKELTVAWAGKHEKVRFATKSTMTVGWDPGRGVYTYDIDSELEVLPGPAFLFKYGFDFEHHTPLDPFNWQYIVLKHRDGSLSRRPVGAFDPGPQMDLETSEGLRVWHGRHNDPVPLCPAVEYRIRDVKSRKMNTAVCAAFHDTGVSFERETLPAGEKIRVQYRYTGYPAAEAEKLFKAAKTYDSPTIDPNHHFIFAEWPRTSFAKFAAMSEAWPRNLVPFMTGHNQRPTYAVARVDGTTSGYAMKLGPLAFGEAKLPIPGPLPAGGYALTVKAKGVNLHGPGGWIQVSAVSKDGRILLNTTHHIGAGSFGWKEAGFAFDLPAEAKSLTLGLGNGGTGDVFFTDAEVLAVKPAESLPTDVAATANSMPAKVISSPAGAIADYRMVESRGLHSLDFASGPFGLLELANLDWVTDEGRPALRFADNSTGKSNFPGAGKLDLSYLRNKGYHGKESLPVALAGHHGGGFELKGFTLVSWIKPATEMGQGGHGGKGDVLGVGARRIVLRLVGQKAPYRLQAALNVNDVFTTDAPKLDANHWYQVAVTGEPAANNKWAVKLYVDGNLVNEGVTKNLASPLTLPPSIVMGTEIFYFHDAYYRGLIGRTLVFDRQVAPAELKGLRPIAE